MNKWFYLTETDLLRSLELLHRKDSKEVLVLRSSNDWHEVAIYSHKYNTVVFSSLSDKQLKERLKAKEEHFRKLSETPFSDISDLPFL